MTEKLDPYVYPHSLHTAKQNTQLSLWEQSSILNHHCKEELSGLCWEAEEGSLDQAQFGEVIEKYGVDRVMYVLAANQKFAGDDFPAQDRYWARGLVKEAREECGDYDMGRGFHKVITEMTRLAQEHIASLDILNQTHCEAVDGDREGKVLVLKPSALFGDEKTAENQLFLATAGFGCNEAVGGKVFGICLKTGEKSAYRHTSFYSGAIKDENLPDWAREKLRELLGEEPAQAGDAPQPQMGI